MKTFKQLLDERCWPGYKPVPGKKAYTPGSCVKEEIETLEEKGPGLWANIRAKKARGERMRKPGEEGAPTDAQIKSIRASEEVELSELSKSTLGSYLDKASTNARQLEGTRVRGGTQREKFLAYKKIKKEISNRYAGMDRAISKLHSKVNKEEYEQDDGALTEDQLEQIREAAAWERAEGKNPEGGLNRKGIESYRRENPGSKLSMAVTTKPSKLDPDSKAAKRRKSFCARMGGMKKRLTSAETARDPDSRINKALRKWNC
jgi:hypothetical protein